jgi:hypothetical protein
MNFFAGNMSRFGGGWGNCFGNSFGPLGHPGGWLGQLTNNHFHGWGDDFGGRLGNSRFQVNNLSSFSGIGGMPQFGFGGIGGGFNNSGGWGWGNGQMPWGRDYMNVSAVHHGSWGRNNDSRYNSDIEWGDAVRRSGHGISGFGSAAAYGLGRSGDRLAGGDILGGLGEMLLAPIRGLKGMFAGCEMREAPQQAGAPPYHAGNQQPTRFLGS